MTLKLADILYAIEQLTPGERRLLQRRLRAAGLLLPESGLTDRNRLACAPALGAWQPHASTEPISPRPSPPASSSTASPLPPGQVANGVIPAPVDDRYHSPVSGKVVVGAPGDTPADAAHGMQPVPGQAPESPIVVIFDGGSKGNPGRGYGSYALRWPGRAEQVVRLQFGDRVTNNEAEYDTLIQALETILTRLRDNHADPATARVQIYGDSLLVVNQVTGAWKSEEPRMRLRRDRVRELLDQVGRWQISHHDRNNSVRVLGH